MEQANLTTRGFGERLSEAVEARNNPLCVGLDPHPHLLPAELGAAQDSADRAERAAAVQTFCAGIIDAVADCVAVVKPQIAFFERLGPSGWQALEAVVGQARAAGLLVIADAKRGDIGSTATAYADYHLGEQGLNADAVTVNPFMGADTLAPFARYFVAGKGLFALARTSNPGADTLQLAATDPHPRDKVGEMCRSLEGNEPGQGGYRATGLVVGATRPAEARIMRERFPDLPFLVPGLGAQGASAEDLGVCFNADGLGAVVNASRSVLFAYARDNRQDWQAAAREEAQALGQALNQVRRR